ncbi:MAG TPA: CoA transferase [Candidatus Dormibacteraeota bacterium]|nr:CoA transferase [Candidatus Dormibacteraeota bacterium]
MLGARTPSRPDRVDPIAAPSPLAGIRILDLTHALAGPYCTMLLGDLGADVIKVEPPSGDHSRQWGPPFIDGESSYFLSVNRNKRSVVLDLKSKAGHANAEAMAMASDVVVENFKPGTMDRLGLGAKKLQGMKPELVYAAISGFGQNQPTLAGYDQIAQGTSGMMSVNATPDGPPTKVGIPIGDIAAGMFASQAILASLVERGRTGKGRYIDIALNDSLLALFTYQAGRYFATGEVPTQEGNHHATIAPYGTFAVSDGFLNVAVATDAQFQRFCEAIRAPELADDQRFATNPLRQTAKHELARVIEGYLRRSTREEWLVRFEQFGIPAGPILDMEEAFASPLATARDMRQEIHHPTAHLISQVGAPWKIDGMSSPIRLPPPLLGQHTDEVLREVARMRDPNFR